MTWRRAGSNAWHADFAQIWAVNLGGKTAWRIWVNDCDNDRPIYRNTIGEAKAYAEALAPFGKVLTLL